MLQSKNCDNCGEIFHYKISRRPNARFCSWSCLSKKTKQEQDQKRKAKWESETYEEYVAAMENKFKKFAVKKDGCWDWNGSKHKQGYGIMRHRNKPIKAHRASYIIHKGEIIGKLLVLHSCDNTSCTNPEHLFLGTQSDNVRDMVSKGRNYYEHLKKFQFKKGFNRNERINYGITK